MATTIVFDVNETLLDLAALNDQFEHIFGDAAVKSIWFGQVLQTALVMTIIGDYMDFGSVAGVALDKVAGNRNIMLSSDDRQRILGTMLNLPAHADVVPGLARLHDAGFRLAALTNSAQAAAETQLKNAGLNNFFEVVMSVEAVQCFKPSEKVYAMAASRLGDNPDNLRLVAAHDWDIAGAINAGWSGAFVARNGEAFGARYPQPDITGKSILDVADRIIESR